MLNIEVAAIEIECLALICSFLSVSENHRHALYIQTYTFSIPNYSVYEVVVVVQFYNLVFNEIEAIVNKIVQKTPNRSLLNKKLDIHLFNPIQPIKYSIQNLDFLEILVRF